jgi:hypothetical protein
MATKISNRLSHCVVDEIGLDPLRDGSFEAIIRITDYNLYDVTEAEEGNLPLIAFKVYSDKTLWWAILIYNRLADPFEVKRGLRLKIPSYPKVISALNENLRSDVKIKYVEI